MDFSEKETIKRAVRERYGSIGTGCSITSEPLSSSACCSSDLEATQEQIATSIGYSESDIGSAPQGSNLGLGCGNPVAIASLKEGETVVDLGSGGGFDCFLASRKVGESGRVIGVDMTSEMISKGRENTMKMAANNVEFRLGEIENLPIADNSVDIIMSNCVINLSPEKSKVFQEAFRVLKPGGRLAISDVVATITLPEEIKNNQALVCSCVGGAVTIDENKKMLREAGFQKIRILPKNESRKLIKKWTPIEKVENYVVAANIEAIKP